MNHEELVVGQETPDVEAWRLMVVREEGIVPSPCEPIVCLTNNYTGDALALEWTSRAQVEAFIAQLQRLADEVWPV